MHPLICRHKIRTRFFFCDPPHPVSVCVSLSSQRHQSSRNPFTRQKHFPCWVRVRIGFAVSQHCLNCYGFLYNRLPPVKSVLDAALTPQCDRSVTFAVLDSVGWECSRYELLRSLTLKPGAFPAFATVFSLRWCFLKSFLIICFIEGKAVICSSQKSFADERYCSAYGLTIL